MMLRKGNRQRNIIDSDSLERQLYDVAEVLMNMIIIAEEKKKLCKFYNVFNGICSYIRIDTKVPTLSVVQDGDKYRVNVSIHPEVCAVCPFWEKRD